MKNWMLFSITINTLCAFNIPADYRDSYVGNYFCNRTSVILNANQDGRMSVRDTVTISVSKDIADSVVDIVISHHTYKAKLVNDEFYSYAGSRQLGGGFSSGGRIDLTITPALGPSTQRYSGKRK